MTAAYSTIRFSPGTTERKVYDQVYSRYKDLLSPELMMTIVGDILEMEEVNVDELRADLDETEARGSGLVTMLEAIQTQEATKIEECINLVGDIKARLDNLSKMVHNATNQVSEFKQAN